MGSPLGPQAVYLLDTSLGCGAQSGQHTWPVRPCEEGSLAAPPGVGSCSGARMGDSAQSEQAGAHRNGAGVHERRALAGKASTPQFSKDGGNGSQHHGNATAGH